MFNVWEWKKEHVLFKSSPYARRNGINRNQGKRWTQVIAHACPTTEVKTSNNNKCGSDLLQVRVIPDSSEHAATARPPDYATN